MGELIATTRPTVEIVREGFKTFEREHPEENNSLMGEMLYLGAAVLRGKNTTFGEEVASRIEETVAQINQAGEHVTVEKYVNSLFSPNKDGKITADMIMLRLQLGI